MVSYWLWWIHPKNKFSITITKRSSLFIMQRTQNNLYAPMMQESSRILKHMHLDGSHTAIKNHNCGESVVTWRMRGHDNKWKSKALTWVTLQWGYLPWALVSVKWDHLFNKYLLITSRVTGTVLGTGDTELNEIDSSLSCGAYVLAGRDRQK